MLKAEGLWRNEVPFATESVGGANDEKLCREITPGITFCGANLLRD
jgi:hypothetical protein